MAAKNFKLDALVKLRDNVTNGPYPLIPQGGSGTYTFYDYEVTSIGYSAGNLAPTSTGTYQYNISLTGGSRINELLASTRTNCTWTITGATNTANSTKGTQTNTSCVVNLTTQDALQTIYLDATWNDGYNPEKTYRFTIVGSAPAVPGVPTVSAASNITDNSFRANWILVSNTSYKVWVTLASNGSTVTDYYPADASTNNYKDVTGLNGNTTYNWKVSAYNISGDSGFSDTLPALTKPRVPTGLFTTAINSNDFTANWTASAGGAAGGYKVYVATNTSFSPSNIRDAATTSNTYYVVSSTTGTAPIGNTTYYWKVIATNASGDSSTPSYITVLTKPEAAINPSNNSITKNSFIASWTAPTNGGSPSYKIIVSQNSNYSSPVVNTTTSNTTYDVTELSANTKYYWKVISTNTSGDGPASEQVITTLIAEPAAPLLATPSPTTFITATGFTANWQQATTATGYKLYVSTDNTFPTNVTTTYTISGLSNTTYNVSLSGDSGNTTYYWRVTATNAGGESVSSQTATVLTLPAAPTIVSTTNFRSNGFTVTWGAPPNGANGYKLYVYLASNNTIAGGYDGSSTYASNATSDNLIGLSANTAYYWKVAAVNDTGISTLATSPNVITSPAAPTALTQSLVEKNSFTANWTAPAGAVSYKVWVTTMADSNYNTPRFTATGVSNTYVSVTGTPALTAGTQYRWKVVATGTSGDGDYAERTTWTKTDAPVPVQPSTAADNAFIADWSAPTGADSYKLWVYNADGFVVSGYNGLPVSTNSAVVNGLAQNSTYTWKVRAVNIDGVESADSSTATGTTLRAIPDVPQNLITSLLTTSGFTATWDEAANADGYRLAVATDSGLASFVNGYNPYTLNGRGATTWSVTGLTQGTLYYWSVKSWNTRGDSSYKVPTIGVTLPLTTPYISISNKTATSFTLSWGVSNTSNITGYKVWVSTTANFSSGFVGVYNAYATTLTSVNITGLSADTMYYAKVIVYNSIVESNYSSTSAATLLPTPIGLSTSNIGQTSFRANWSGVTGANQYHIEVATNNTFDNLVIDDYTTNSYYQTETVLNSSTQYYWRVTAINTSTSNYSVPSSTISVTTLAPMTGYIDGPTQPGIFEDYYYTAVISGGSGNRSYSWNYSGPATENVTVTNSTSGTATFSFDSTTFNGTKSGFVNCAITDNVTSYVLNLSLQVTPNG